MKDATQVSIWVTDVTERGKHSQGAGVGQKVMPCVCVCVVRVRMCVVCLHTYFHAHI